MGFDLRYDKGEGPAIKPPLRAASDLERLREVEPQESLAHLLEAIRRTRADSTREYRSWDLPAHPLPWPLT